MATETAKATGGSSVGECQPGFRTRAGPGEDTCEAPWEMGVSWTVGVDENWKEGPALLRSFPKSTGLAAARTAICRHRAPVCLSRPCPSGFVVYL